MQPLQPILKPYPLNFGAMKFEGPTPETETRQVSISFAAFIIVAAFALFGLAMALGTVTGIAPQASSQSETTVPGEGGFESAPAPAPLPAITQPDPAAMTTPDPDDTADNTGLTEGTNAAMAEPAPTPQPGAVPAVAPSPGEAAKAPAPPADAATAAPQADTHNPSFPTRHKPSAPAAPAAAPAAQIR